jgi:hypothetical protein
VVDGVQLNATNKIPATQLITSSRDVAVMNSDADKGRVEAKKTTVGFESYLSKDATIMHETRAKHTAEFNAIEEFLSNSIYSIGFKNF